MLVNPLGHTPSFPLGQGQQAARNAAPKRVCPYLSLYRPFLAETEKTAESKMRLLLLPRMRGEKCGMLLLLLLPPPLLVVIDDEVADDI